MILKIVIKCVAPRPYAFYRYFQLENAPWHPNDLETGCKKCGAYVNVFNNGQACQIRIQHQGGFPNTGSVFGRLPNYIFSIVKASKYMFGTGKAFSTYI